MPPVTNLKRMCSILIDSDVYFDFLLPNGITIQLTINSELTLKKVMSEVWKAVANQPLFNILQSEDHYIFCGLNRETAAEEEFYDRTRRIRELSLLLPVLRIVEAAKDSVLLEVNARNAIIANCTGICHTDLIRSGRSNTEVLWARIRLLRLSNIHSMRIARLGPARYLLSAPCHTDLTQSLKIKLQTSSHLHISAWILDHDQTRRVYLDVEKKATVEQTLNEIIRIQAKWCGVAPPHHHCIDTSKYVLKVCCSQCYMFDLNQCLIHYEYVQNCLDRDEVPCLSPILMVDVDESLKLALAEYKQHVVGNTDIDCMPSTRTSNDFNDDDNLRQLVVVDEAVDEASNSAQCLWTLSGYLTIHVRMGQFCINSASVVDRHHHHHHHQLPMSGAQIADELEGTYVVRVGLFHGSQSLIEFQTTSEVPGTHMAWNKWLNFHVCLADIPPSARICIALIRIYSSAHGKNGRTCECPYGWANMNLFDQRGFMTTDDRTLHLWPASLVQTTEQSLHCLHPLGTVFENPNPDVTIQIKVHNPTNCPIQRPTTQSYIDAFRQSKLDADFRSSVFKVSSNPTFTNNNHVFGTGEMESDLEACLSDSPPPPNSTNSPSNSVALDSFLLDIISRDPFYELCEQEKQALWSNRYWCLDNLPEALPWLIQAVCWHKRDILVEFYHLLDKWPRPLDVGVALQLLGAIGITSHRLNESTGTDVSSTTSSRMGGGASGAADAFVRQLAVSSLYDLSDVELDDYLLQLVQALKAEAYLDNALTRFLLHRSLASPLKIGLRLFWLLRSEIHLADMRLRFGLILDAFCHGSGPLLSLLARQITALNRLESIHRQVQIDGKYDDEQRLCLTEQLNCPEALHDLQWLPSPLNLCQVWGQLVVSKCTVKRSKKRPFWLVWTNADRLGSYHRSMYEVIFKAGDDLRQDMLTLQLLRVMDRIWKQEGLDMCLVPYGCLSTGPEMGLIEAVRDARTVMSIQNDRLRSALQIDSSQLHKWLCQNVASNDNTAAYERLVDTFTHSCAGYCVATFVLGIRDRHPDNIMVDKHGRLFHIDFGHILDNRKKKFGITRERVPFVLTKDFITVIGRGLTANTVEMTNGHVDKFAQLCGRAYLVLRKQSNLLLTLLGMMLPSGLPELTSVYDLEYVRYALAIDMNEQQALEFFQQKFNEAYRGAWTTKIDWFSHWMNT